MAQNAWSCLKLDGFMLKNAPWCHGMGISWHIPGLVQVNTLESPWFDSSTVFGRSFTMFY